MSQYRALPLQKDASSRFLPFLIGLMLFFGCLSLAAVMLLNQAAGNWEAGLAGSLTIQAPADPAPQERAAAMELAIDLLSTTPGVTAARQIDEAEMNRLLAPWLGETQSLTDLPLPRMIDVAIDTDAPPDFADLQQRLEQLIPGIAIDDHSLWLDKMVTITTSLRLLAVAVLAMILAAIVLTVIFAIRAGLSTHHATIGLIHAIGATDRWLARLFERHALLLTLKGVVAGLVLAVAVLLGLGEVASRFNSDLIPDISLGWLGWLVVLALPAFVLLLSWFTARVTVLAVLAREP